MLLCRTTIVGTLISYSIRCMHFGLFACKLRSLVQTSYSGQLLLITVMFPAPLYVSFVLRTAKEILELIHSSIF